MVVVDIEIACKFSTQLLHALFFPEKEARVKTPLEKNLLHWGALHQRSAHGVLMVRAFVDDILPLGIPQSSYNTLINKKFSIYFQTRPKKHKVPSPMMVLFFCQSLIEPPPERSAM